MNDSAQPNPGSLTAILKIAANLTCACLIAGGAIAATFAITEPYAVKNRIKFSHDAMQQLIPEAETFALVDSHPGWFSAKRGSATLGYIMNIQTKGYGGAIKIVAAADTSGAVIGYAIVAHNETPGLGDQADKPKFKEQFIGKHAAQLVVVKTGDPEKIDAISGATITSNAVTTGIRKELERLVSSLHLPAAQERHQGAN